MHHFLAFALMAWSLAGQQPTTLDPAAQKVKDRIAKIGVAGRITIILKNGSERYGTVVQVEATTFEIVEVDLKQRLTFSYAEVEKVRKNYGGRNLVSGKRPNPLWGIIAGAALFGTLLILVMATVGGS
jgi:hypothetical protein